MIPVAMVPVRAVERGESKDDNGDDDDLSSDSRDRGEKVDPRFGNAIPTPGKAGS